MPNIETTFIEEAGVHVCNNCGAHTTSPEEIKNKLLAFGLYKNVRRHVMKKLLETIKYATLSFIVCSIISAILIFACSGSGSGGLTFVIGFLLILLTFSIPLAIIIIQYEIVEDCLVFLISAAWAVIPIMGVLLIPILILQCFSIEFPIIIALLDKFPFEYYLCSVTFFLFIGATAGWIKEEILG